MSRVGARREREGTIPRATAVPRLAKPARHAGYAPGAYRSIGGCRRSGEAASLRRAGQVSHRGVGGAGVPRLSRRLSPAATCGARGSPSVPLSRPAPTRDVSRVGLLVGVVRAGLSRRDEPEQPELRPERFARHAEASCRRAPMVAMLAEAGEDGGELHLADDLLERAGAVGRRCGVLDDPRGEQLRHDPLAGLGAEDETVDLIGQLAHVPGPGVALERPQRPGMEPAQRLRFRRRHVLEKVDGERTDVVPALAEWREPDRKDAQTVQQVLPEGARAHGLFEVAIRRCDDPDVDLADRLATDRSHLAVLEDAEELCLDRGGRFPDLVEKERPDRKSTRLNSSHPSISYAVFC